MKLDRRQRQARSPARAVPPRRRPGITRVAVFAYPGALQMCVVGVREILELANTYGSNERFLVQTFEDLRRQRRALDRFLGDDDTSFLVVPSGGLGSIPSLTDERVSRELARASSRGVVVVGICTGNFALAHAGLLHARTATTHWGLERDLGARFPDIQVSVERILIDHGDVVSVGGMTAFIDFCLWLVAQRESRALARRLARILMVAPERESQLPWMEIAPRSRLDDAAMEALVSAVERNPARPWSSSEMARSAAMSRRTLERRLRAAVGVAPAKLVQEKRLALARRLLEDGASVADACSGCGWTDPSSFVRLFTRRIGMTPARYRAWARGNATELRKGGARRRSGA